VLPTSALLVVEDHTQTQQLQRLEIETANLRLIKTMADRLAHEIGNAMVPLSTHQQLLPEKYKDPEFRNSLAGAMADGVRRVSRLINQMRFLARDFSEPRQAFPLAPLIEEAYHEAQKYQPNKSAKLLFEPGDQPAFLVGDRAALKHAFTEVLLNALQANPADPKVIIRVSLGAENASQAYPISESQGSSNGHHSERTTFALHIEIQDNGAGFSPDAVAKVPEPFFTTRNVGLGLGMTVSRKIIETHHGQLSILKPTPGQSGIVRISLPASTDADTSTAIT
jgi:signal transduction histidine kinase